MRRPGTDIEWEDRSGATPIDITDRRIKPLELAVSSFDKGPTDLRRVNGKDFYKLYGQNISYDKHGQPAIQAANAINNGAELLVKRLVTNDMNLANAIIVAEVSSLEVDKVDEAGNPVYIDADTGAETSEPGVDGANERAKIKSCIIKYDAESVENAKTIKDVMAAVPGCRKSVTADLNAGIATASEIGEGEVDPWGDEEGNGTDPTTPTNPATPEEPAIVAERYPLFVITDNGVGKSSKRIRFTTDYILSKNIGFPLYSIEFIGAQDFDYEYARFTLDPSTIYLGNNMALSMSSKQMIQVVAKETNYYEAFVNKISELTGIELTAMKNYDLLMGKDLKGRDIPQITVDPDGFDLSSAYGIHLENGTDGSFEDVAFGTEAWSKAAIEVFDGTFDDNIFDRDMYPIETVIDANYPLEVKKSICDLLKFRQDFFYFKDVGLNATTFEEIQDLILGFDIDKNTEKFIANYIQSYDIIDPFSKKQVPVTIGYSLARLVTIYLSDRSIVPFAGMSTRITEAIEGTISFIPKETPKVDQKTLCTESNLNYAGYVNGALTLELQLTANVGDTQCSHIHTILNIQNLLRLIREVCPLSRYTPIKTENSLKNYAKDVQEIIDNNESAFKTLQFQWTADQIQLANGLFNATILASNDPYIQAEKFIICTID